MSQRKVNLVRINFKSATELRLVRLEEYMCVKAPALIHIKGITTYFNRGVELDL